MPDERESTAAGRATDAETAAPQGPTEPAEPAIEAGLVAKYAGLSAIELERRFKELALLFERTQAGLAAERFEDPSRHFSEPVDLSDLADLPRVRRLPSAPRTDELLREQTCTDPDSGAIAYRWTYLSAREYPELHALKRELD